MMILGGGKSKQVYIENIKAKENIFKIKKLIGLFME
jgi:hypothetical protein